MAFYVIRKGRGMTGPRDNDRGIIIQSKINNLMEENKQTHECKCPFCMMRSHMTARIIIRWALGLVILVLVFCVGIKVGEFKNEVKGEIGAFTARQCGCK